jgi:hypothetical protein
MEISWTDRTRNEEVLHRVQEERNILCTRNRIKANLIGHILRRNCLLKHIIKGKIQVTGRQKRRRKQLPDDFKDMKKYRKLKQESLARTVWRTGFGRGCGLVVRQTTLCC